jgi:hypothetical protein
MARNPNRDHYDRPSWSERDKMRGKRKESGSAATARPVKEPNRYQQKVMDERFQSLFSDPKKEQALRKVREQVGKDGFVEAVEAYRVEFGLPEEYDLLQVILENHTIGAVRAEALERMDAAVDAQAASTQQVFKTRVKLLALTAREPELKKLAGKISRARKF